MENEDDEAGEDKNESHELGKIPVGLESMNQRSKGSRI